jgi:ferredoxin
LIKKNMITVDQAACIGCGACVALCPSVFEMNDEGKSIVISQDNVACAQEAATSCPVQAIAVA